jgi:hypothetical protein
MEILRAVAGDVDGIAELYKIIDTLLKTDRLTTSAQGKLLVKQRVQQEARAYTDFDKYIVEAKDYDIQRKLQQQLAARLSEAANKESAQL